MAKYLLRRVFQSIFTVLAVVTVVFIGGRLIGNPAALMLGSHATQEAIRDLTVSLGLDQPLHIQYLEFMRGLLAFDFGVSFYHGQPVLELVLRRLPATLLLAGATIVVAHPIGVLLGLLAAAKPASLIDRAVTAVSLAGVSIVNFWIALVLVIVFAVGLGLVPTSGYGGMAQPQYLVLPVIALALRPIGRMSQITRSAMLDELSKPYIKAARARGISERRILYSYAFKNASIPVVTMAGDDAIQLLNGIVVIETIFAWPGLGLLLVQSLSTRDLPMLEAMAFVVAMMVVVVNLIVDASYSYLDPRVRYG